MRVTDWRSIFNIKLAMFLPVKNEVIMNKNSEIFNLLHLEHNRQNNGINLIASENYASESVLKLTGSCLMNKYVEGYPGARYYSGCEFVDQLEIKAQDLFKKLFGVEHVNVQPHSGSQANQAAFLAFLNPGDTILSMKLAAGGHLTHGHPINMTGKLFKIASYSVSEKTEHIDYDEVERLAMEHKPKMIIAGASAYSRTIDFERFGNIAKKSGALLLADIAHIAGLVVAGLHPSPFPYADIVTTTTHKTFRGPRGAVIMCKKEFAKVIDRAVMPGTQGGAFAHVIAAKAQACEEALAPEYVVYQKQVILNAQAMSNWFQSAGYRIVAGGTDNHLFMIDLTDKNISGKEVEKALEQAQIFVNRNMVPFDTRSPLETSGIRIGTPAITSRAANVEIAIEIAQLIHEIISFCIEFKDHDVIKTKYKQSVENITQRLKIF
jgi:glycine hydroxymethyltransferase